MADRLIQSIVVRFRGNRVEEYRSRIPLGELIEFPPAMTQAQLEEIPKAIIKKEHTDLLTQCAICFQEFKLNEDEVRELRCHHMYHDACIFPWLRSNPSCPICRAQMPDQNNVAEFDDVIRQRFAFHIVRYLFQHGLESAEEEEESPARTFRTRLSVAEDVTPQRAAALRARHAIQRIYRPRRTVRAQTTASQNGVLRDRSPHPT